MYLRSALRRGRDGLLRCANDLPGRDELTLAELTASRAATLSRQLGMQSIGDGACPDTDSQGVPNSGSSYLHVARRMTVDDVYASGVPTYASPGTRVNKAGF
jgi:hypothetical protein